MDELEDKMPRNLVGAGEDDALKAMAEREGICEEEWRAENLPASTLELRLYVAAGLSAGSIPTSGKSGYISLSTLTAADVAELHAITHPFTGILIKSSTLAIVSSLTSSVVFVP